MEQTLNNKEKYKRLDIDPTLELQKKSNIIVQMLEDQKYITKKQKRRLKIFNAQAPRPYAVVKLHKIGHPIRIIIASINSPSYHITKYIHDILKPVTENNKYNVRNSYDLKSKLNSTTLTNDEIIASLDVVAMYESIPLSLVYQSIKNNWLEISKHTQIPANTFINMVKFCIEETNYMLFNSKIYKPKSGIAIGSCVSPIIADLVMTDILNSAVHELGYDPILLVKYVDDILIIAPKDEIENTLTVFNNINESIKFTIEYEDENSINYLDMKIIRSNNHKIKTDFYQKPTSKGRILNWKSNHPYFQKENTAMGLISRALKLSSECFWKTNIDIVKRLLTKNNYPNNLIESLVKKVINQQKLLPSRSTQTSLPDLHIQQTQETSPILDNLQTQSLNQQTTNTLPVTEIASSEPKAIKYIGVNYENKLTENIGKLFRKYSPNMNIGYRPTKTIRNTQRSKKDPIPKMCKSGVVYSLKCKGCSKVYIGQTGQKLQNRITQHKSDLRNKQKIIAKKKNSTGALQHTINTNHVFNYEQPTILGTETNWSKRLTLEMLYIVNEGENAVNLKSDIEALDSTYTQLLQF